ncbi:nSTAND1 domain-containing NTPase [Shewanella glacialimarina]|uniref:nSTAND1 domain-containing NTPase n=1 Tax=Shewanella glacialimarina TaxID=2590884 RepID=UPI001CF823E2|nr:winged helix-turn-helix domain-containing protein [Shewanella glacialimarina]UCX03704.1 transcriptional regulator [Shewanella glacialimarina]
MNKQHFFFGVWQVNPESNSLQQGADIKQIEPKAMDVLQLLCQHPGEVLSPDTIVEQCWGHTVVGDNPLHKIINQLRKTLGDSASNPTFIETIRKRGYRTLAEVHYPLVEQAEHIQANTWQGGSPFPGLRAFDAKDAEVFYGRSEQISTLLKRMSNQVQFGRAFCLLLGPSGSGKSSLLNAGVVPQFMRPQGFDGIGIVSHTSLDLADISQDRLFTDIALALLDLDINDIPVFDGMTAENLAVMLQQDMPKVIEQAKQALANIEQTNTAITPKLSIFIDRVEVLLSSPIFTEPHIQTALDMIESLATSGYFMVFSACRNDFYPQVVSRPSLMAGKASGSHFDLTAPNRTELLQMIRLPAKAAGLNWDTDPQTHTPLDELLCAEAANNPDALPMLQYTLQELYLQRDEHNTLLVSVYQKLGGIEGAIGQKAEGIFAALAAKHQHSLSKVLSLLVTLSADETNITSRAARLSQLSNDNETALVHTLIDNRLFVSHLQNGQGCFSVAHEALLRRWPRVLQWIEAHRDSLRVNARLTVLSQRWQDEQQHKAYLLAEGKPLQEALALADNPLFNLDTEQHAFIHASKKSVGVKRLAKMSTIAVLCMLTLLAVFMSVRSIQAEQFAKQKQQQAESLLGFMVGEFADKLRSVGRMDLLDGITQKSMEYFASNDQQTNASAAYKKLSYQSRLQHGQALAAKAEVAYSRGDNSKALTAFIDSQKILQALYDETRNAPDIELLKLLGANAFWVGQIALNDRKDAETLKQFELYRDYSIKMNQIAPDNIDSWIELSYAYNSLGSLFFNQNNFSNAQRNFELSLELKKKALVQSPQDSLLASSTADTYSWIASTAMKQGDLELALSLHEQAQAVLAAPLAETPNNAPLLEILSYSLIHQVNILSAQAKWQQAYQKSETAYSLLDNLFKQDPENRSWRERRFNFQAQKLGISAQLAKQNGLPLSDFTTPQKLLEQLAKEYAFTNKVANEYEQLNNKVIFEAIKYYQTLAQWQDSEQLLEQLNINLKKEHKTPSSNIFWAEVALLNATQAKHNQQPNLMITSCKLALANVPEKYHPFEIEINQIVVVANLCLQSKVSIAEQISALNKMDINVSTHYPLLTSKTSIPL